MCRELIFHLHVNAGSDRLNTTSQMKAISKFKSLIHSRASTPRTQTPRAEDKDRTPRQSITSDHIAPISEEDRQHAEHAARLVEERIQFLRKHSSHGEKGHAHDPTDVEPLFLGIGTGGRDNFTHEAPAEVVSDSPTAVDFNVYDTAYESEVKRIRSQSDGSKVYFTKHLSERDRYKTDSNIIDGTLHGSPRQEAQKPSDVNPAATVHRNHKFAELVAEAVKDSKSKAECPEDAGSG